MLSDRGSQSIYIDRFWAQVLSKYLQGTQGHPELCFSGFKADSCHCAIHWKKNGTLTARQLSYNDVHGWYKAHIQHLFG